MNYSNEMFESIRDYRKIVFLKFSTKIDINILKDLGLSNDIIEKLYNDCRQKMDKEMDDSFSHIKILEESILENNYY